MVFFTVEKKVVWKSGKEIVDTEASGSAKDQPHWPSIG